MCAYCGIPGSSTSGDHVLARAFALKRHRAKLPQVPACDRCNNEKSKLETQLTPILPFGGRHLDAFENITTLVPPRLAKNAALAASLNLSPSWLPGPSGLWAKTSTVQIPADEIERLVVYWVRGLSSYHWGVHFSGDFDFDVGLPTGDGLIAAEQVFGHKADNRVSNRIGGDALIYEGVLDKEPLCCAWKISIYGGLTLGGADPRVRSSMFVVYVTPKAGRCTA